MTALTERRIKTMAKHPGFETVKGPILYDQVVPPGQPWGRIIQKGDILRLVDLEGQQAVDFLCYNARNPAERYNAADTMKIQDNIFLGKGTALYSGMGNKLFTVIADTCGRHDTIGGCCSAESNFVRYGVMDTANCRDNFLKVLAEFGLGKKDIVANINFFMYVPVGPDGAMGIADGVSAPGSYLDLKAEMNVLAVLSNCPQMHNPAAGYNPTPIRVIVWRQERSL
jgi:urea carboxylase-associated protein 1